ncbi:MAG: putative lipid II flippase FtsW [Solirubrobacterales bacterium]
MRSPVASVREGVRLRGGRRKPGGQPVEHSLALTATMCLVAFGVVMVFSASSTTSLLGETGDGFFYLKRTLMFGAIGLIALRLLSAHGLESVRRLTPAFLAVCFGLLLLTLVPGVGSSANGAQRWIAAGPIQIQASELAKIALVLYGADLLARRPGMTKDLYSMRPYLIVVAAACLLIVVQPDLGTAMIAAFSVAALLIAAGTKLRHLALIAGVLALFALIAIVIEPYRQERVFSFLSPGADASGAGYQGSQAAVALGSGGIFGVGLGESVQKAFYLPEAHTDMIAAVIGEEIGLIGLGGMITLYLLLGYAGFRTAQRAPDRYGRLLAAGLTSMILTQATINLFAVMGMAPLTGVTLPFVSYGNSSLIVTLAAVGILLNIAAGGTATERRDRPVASSRSRSRSRARPGSAARGKRPLKLVEGGGQRPRHRRPRRRSV